MVNFWRFHWLWCCCVLHSNLLVAGDEETVPLYKKMLSDTRESVKFSDPKYSHILRGTESDLRRTGSDIVKKSNDHLEKQTAPNRVNRVLPAPASASESNRSVADQVGLFQNGSDNATRNARDLSYDAVAVAATDATIAALVSSKNHSSDLAYSLDTTENKKTTTFSNDTVLDESAPSTPISAPTPTAAPTPAPTPTSASTSNATTVSTLILKNPKDKQNKTKLDFNPSFAKKAAVNVKAKNASSSSAENVQKPEISVSLNDSRYDNSSQSVVSGDQWNYNVTVNVQNTNSKNISLLTAALGEGEANETKMAATSRRTMQESQPFNTLNLALITITAFAVLCIIVVLSMMFVMLYRRYHWNKPQTLSDKCSNADSTGYIDDSTLKENSEEMYSLDNDSFLNSLEAMTIQNYWADSIRHTKL